MDKRGSYADDWQQLKWKYNLLDEIGVAGDNCAGLSQHFGKKIEYDESGKQHERVICGGAGEAPTGFEYDTKGNGVDNK